MANTSTSTSSVAAFRTVAASSPLDWTTAVQSMHAYRENCNHLYTYYQKPGSSCVHKAILQGFRVKVSALQQLIDGELTDSVVPDEIFISFGVAPECLAANPDDQGFTVLLSGIKFMETGDVCGEIITAGETPVLEYCDACPPKCPRNLAQHLNVFQDYLPCCPECEQDARCNDCTDPIAA